MRVARLLLLLGLALPALPALPAAAEPQDTILTPPALRALEKALDESARAQREEAVEDILDVLVRLGHPAEAVDDLRAEARKRLERARRRKDTVPRAAKALQDAAAKLAVELEGVASEEERRRLAAVVLRLDGLEETAHRALGHVEHEGAWVDADLPKILAGRTEVAEILRRVRRLEVPIEVTESPLPMTASVLGNQGHVARSKLLSVHSAQFAAERCARVCREAVRAAALGWWALTGTLEIPPSQRHLDMLLVRGRPSYEKLIAESVANGGMAAADEAMTRASLTSYWDRRGHMNIESRAEADDVVVCVYQLFEQCIFYDLLEGRGEPCLDTGVINWTCLAHVGAPMPGLIFKQTEVTGGTEDPTVGRRDPEERETAWRLAQAGLAGTRSWLRYLARGREDPPWRAAMPHEFGMIQGNELLKCTIVTEYLLETGEHSALWKKSRAGTQGTSEARIEAALGAPLADFEDRWRAWLLPFEGGLAERLSEPREDEIAPEVQGLLRALDDIRRAALEVEAERVFLPLGLDEDLSEGCRLHARYLDLHPEQQTKWPDAHEEYADREGFSPLGARSGRAGVIAPGVRTPEEALDAWMATYFHRLPLLEPRLLRIGWGLEKKIAVLDCTTLCAPPPHQMAVRWPHDEAEDVPLRFRPEIPSPVPGEDQSRWGYPITLQLWHFAPEPDLVMRLFTGGKEVPCHLTTPEAPLNPDLAPRGAWCLIPKAPLAPQTTYTVRVENFPESPSYGWTFTTGKR